MRTRVNQGPARIGIFYAMSLTSSWKALCSQAELSVLTIVIFTSEENTGTIVHTWIKQYTKQLKKVT
jgi:hypothetical protein